MSPAYTELILFCFSIAIADSKPLALCLRLTCVIGVLYNFKGLGNRTLIVALKGNCNRTFAHVFIFTVGNLVISIQRQAFNKHGGRFLRAAVNRVVIAKGYFKPRTVHRGNGKGLGNPTLIVADARNNNGRRPHVDIIQIINGKVFVLGKGFFNFIFKITIFLYCSWMV